MWIRKNLKKNAKKNVRENYWHAVIISLLILVFAGGYGATLSPINILSNSNEQKDISHFPSNYAVDGEDITNIVDKSHKMDLSLPSDNPIWEVLREVRPEKGVLAGIYNSITDSNSVIYGVVNLVNKSFLGGFNNYLLLSAVGILAMTLVQIFFRNILIVGEKRFYLENRVYSDSHIESVVFAYVVKKGYKSGVTIFLRSIYQVLWSFTIIGAFIKPYSYKMVPYILAENPTMKSNDAITLSRKMMNGNKFKTFVLDLSFILWDMLNLVTLGFLSIFYLNSYKTATYAELYMSIREDMLSSNDSASDLFIDRYISDMTTEAHYDVNNYPLDIRHFKRVKTEGYDRKYSILNLLMMFFIFSFSGWIWEVILELVVRGRLVNRGTMHGPWLPIYGTGGLLMLLLLKRYTKSIGRTFFLCMFLSGVLEYSCATFLWVTKGMKWWDYSGYFLNIQGRICLEGLLIFAVGGIAVIYFIAPILDENLNRVNRKKLYWLSWILLVLFASDAVYSIITPNTGEGVTSFNKKILPLDET